MTGLSEVREKLEEIAASIDGDKLHATGSLLRIAMLAREARALMDSEQGGRVAYGPIAAQFPIQEMLDRGWLVVAEGDGWRVAETAEEVDEALARHFDVDSVGDITAILGTESENGEDDE